VTGRPIEAERAAPIVQDQRDPLQLHCVEPRVQVAEVVEEPILDVGLPRATEPDQIDGQATSRPGQLGDHVPPQVRRGRIAVQEDDRIAGARLLVVHGRVQDVDGFPPRCVVSLAVCVLFSWGV
jgi:hypothetical protein